MAKKKAPKINTAVKKAVQEKLNHFIVTYEKIEKADIEMKKSLSADFRKIAVEMFEAVHIKKIWKSGRALATAMKKHPEIVARYIRAGEFLSKVTDAQLEKQGMCAYDVKTNLRKVSSTLAPKDAKGLKKVATKKAPKKVTACNHGTIDGVVTLLKTIVQHEKDLTKLNTLKVELNKVITTITTKEITTPKGVALTKVLVK